MDDKTKKQPAPEEEGLLGKAKNLFDKADDLLRDEFEKSGMKEKLESMADKAEVKAGDALKKLKDLGKNLADKAEGKFDEIAGNLKGKPKEEKKSKNT